MKTFTKKRTIILPIAILTTIASLSLLAWSFFHTEYTSIKTDMVVTPPFEGTYFGMTIEEFCDAMEITEDDLTPATPFDSAKYYDLEEWAYQYARTEDELRYYDQFENQYYFKYEKPIYTVEDYFIDDQPQSVRLIFTNETTYRDKTIPPLLCAVYMEYSMYSENENELAANEHLAWNGIHIDRYGLPIDEWTDEMTQNLRHGNYKAYELDFRTEHKKAKLLSYLYASGMSPEEIEALNVPKMSDEEVSQLIQKTQLPIPIAVVPWQFDINTGSNIGQISDLRDWNGFAFSKAGYIIYYDWFLNELT